MRHCWALVAPSSCAARTRARTALGTTPAPVSWPVHMRLCAIDLLGFWKMEIENGNEAKLAMKLALLTSNEIEALFKIETRIVRTGFIGVGLVFTGVPGFHG